MVSWRAMNYAVGYHLGALAACLLALVAPVHAQTIAYSFQVQAEAKALGASFGDLGTATMNFSPDRDASFRVTGGGNVVHPMDANAVYRYELDMRFALKGDQVQVLSRKNTSNKAGESVLEVVEEIMPYTYLAQVLPRSPKGYTLYGSGGVHTMTYAGAGGDQEVTLKRGPREIAHFYLRPAAHGPAKILRFRINRRTGANLMFVPR